MFIDRQKIKNKMDYAITHEILHVKEVSSLTGRPPRLTKWKGISLASFLNVYLNAKNQNNPPFNSGDTANQTIP